MIRKLGLICVIASSLTIGAVADGQQAGGDQQSTAANQSVQKQKKEAPARRQPRAERTSAKAWVKAL